MYMPCIVLHINTSRYLLQVHIVRVNGADVVDAALCLMNMDASHRGSNGGQITSFLRLFYNSTKLESGNGKLNLNLCFVVILYVLLRRPREERRKEAKKDKVRGALSARERFSNGEHQRKELDPHPHSRSNVLLRLH